MMDNNGIKMDSDAHNYITHQSQTYCVLSCISKSLYHLVIPFRNWRRWRTRSCFWWKLLQMYSAKDL